MEHRVGQHFGNYRLIHFLGRGGFAEVYLGEHAYLKTRAAIKVLHTHLSRQHEQDFFREARTIAHLEHAHIVRILDFGVHEGIPFLVMQYAPHGSLRRMHPRGTVLSTETILSHLKDVVSALQYAHDRRVVHRDVKPENMLLGPRRQILLSDFGLAVVTHSSPQRQNVAGTVSYMAPEQLQGYPCPASDQYALGIVVYEWLCGALPFTGTPLEVATQHLTAAPPPLPGRNPALSPTVEQVVLKALAKEPGQRFTHAIAFAAALEQALLSQASDPRQPGPLGSSPLPSRHLERLQHRALVGRTQEQACLHDLLRETERQRTLPDVPLAENISPATPSRSPSVFVLGDAGIGKTRLAEELGREAEQRGWVIVRTRSYPQESHIPYRIWIEVVRHIVRQELWHPQEELFPPHLRQAFVTLAPELAEMFPQEPHTNLYPPRVEPLWIWEAVFALLTAACKHAPLLLILDDLHWADSSSVELLGYLARRLVDAPVLLAGTYRESDAPPGQALRTLHLELQRERLMVQLCLSPLTDAQISTLVADLPEPVCTAIEQLAHGNPFFAEELARTWLAQGNGTGNVERSSASQTKVPLPGTITAVLDQQLSKLSASCQQLLRCAAVLGGPFSFHTLSSMYEWGRGARGEEGTLSPLEEALEAKILLEAGTGSGIVYHFRHPLLASRLYETLSATRRAMLHRRAGEILRAEYAAREEEAAVLMIHHLEHGGADPQTIADVAEQAGHYSYRLAAYPEAEKYYRLALEQREQLSTGGQPPRQGWVTLAGGYRHHASLLEQLGECLRIEGRYEEARHCYEQALETWSRYATPGEQQQERQLLAMLCIEIGQTCYDSGNFSQAQQCYELAEQTLQEAGIVAGTARASLRLRQSYLPWKQGSYEAAYLLAEEARSLFEQALKQSGSGGTASTSMTRIRRTLAGDPIDLGRTHVFLATIHVGLGRHNDALEHLNRALTIFGASHCQREVAIACCNLGDLYLKKAEYVQAENALRRSLGLAELIGDVPLVAFVLGNLGTLQTRIGELVSAETVLRRGITLIGPLHDSYTATWLYVDLAAALREQGELIKASEMIRRALVMVRVERAAPMIGVTLVALGYLRIEQATEISDERASVRARLLVRARSTLQRALTIQALEAETRIEGHLALARVMLLEGALEAAFRQAAHTLEMAHQLELMWLIPSVHCLLGNISAALGRIEQAEPYFAQASQRFQALGMHVAYGRALQQYGQFLQRLDSPDGKVDHQGRVYLLEAREILRQCHAKGDLQKLEQILGGTRDTPTQQLAMGT